MRETLRGCSCSAFAWPWAGLPPASSGQAFHRPPCSGGGAQPSFSGGGRGRERSALAPLTPEPHGEPRWGGAGPRLKGGLRASRPAPSRQTQQPGPQRRGGGPASPLAGAAAAEGPARSGSRPLGRPAAAPAAPGPGARRRRRHVGGGSSPRAPRGRPRRRAGRGRGRAPPPRRRAWPAGRAERRAGGMLWGGLRRQAGLWGRRGPGWRRPFWGWVNAVFNK